MRSIMPTPGGPPHPTNRKQSRERVTEPTPRGPEKAITCTQNVTELLEREPGLWPCLTTCVVDVEGLTAVHYAAGAGSPEASALFGPDGVLARWRSVLESGQETHHERPDERLVTVNGTYGELPITVLLTVAGAATPAPETAPAPGIAAATTTE